jgi:hypothetical protein
VSTPTGFLEQAVFVRGANVAFGDLTRAEVHERAGELRAAVGWGPTVRVAPVAMAWRELAMTMERDRAATVRDVPPDVLVEMAPRLWIVAPGGSLLA